MATTVIQTTGTMGAVIDRTRLTKFQRYILRRSHPVSLYIETVGYIWAAFYLWNHLILEALLAVVFSRLIANVVAYRANTDALYNTTIGRIALLHIHPVNMTLQALGIVTFGFGLWNHETRVLLAGISLVLLGHLVGWVRVDRRFELQ